MKKASIVTIVSRNYGNRLQNYALSTYLSSVGVQTDTMPLTVPKPKAFRVAKNVAKSALSPLRDKYKAVCWEWFDEEIPWSAYTVSSIGDHLDEYDYFVAGSDQIWNPYFDFNSDRELLTFARPEQKIAYAASLGINELPVDVRDHYAKALRTFKAIAVREDSAADIVEDLIGSQTQVVLDPTMLLKAKQWHDVAAHSRFRPSTNYVFKYFLGQKNQAYDTYIEHLAKRYDAKVIDILSNGRTLAGIGPYEFLYLIEHAKAVVTDSFHGTVFSLLFNKPFVVFDRPSEQGTGRMSSRIDTLLGTFDLQDHRVSSTGELDSLNSSGDYDIDHILRERRGMAESFIASAMEL